jgi:hypothetical protein
MIQPGATTIPPGIARRVTATTLPVMEWWTSLSRRCQPECGLPAGMILHVLFRYELLQCLMLPYVWVVLMSRTRYAAAFKMLDQEKLFALVPRLVRSGRVRRALGMVSTANCWDSTWTAC